MIPGEFIEFAQTLAVSRHPSAANCRSSVSRAYYGAFLSVRDWIESDLGIRCRAGGSEHFYVQRLLIHSGAVEAAQLGRLLQNLQESRTEADYEMKSRNQDQPAAARTAVERAKEILSRLVLCQRSPLRDRILGGMLEYKRKIGG